MRPVKRQVKASPNYLVEEKHEKILKLIQPNGAFIKSIDWRLPAKLRVRKVRRENQFLLDQFLVVTNEPIDVDGDGIKPEPVFGKVLWELSGWFLFGMQYKERLE